MTDDNKEISLEALGGYPDEYTTPHLSDQEIVAELRKSAKSIEAWLKDIDSPEELHAIFDVSKTMDLTASKLKVLQAKMPNKDLLDKEDE